MILIDSYIKSIMYINTVKNKIDYSIAFDINLQIA